MNLQPTLDLCVSDIAYRSFSDQYRVHGFKNRKGDEIEVRIPKSYRAAFERWLAFRAEAFPANTVERLFPFIGRDGVESNRQAEMGFRLIAGLLGKAQRPRIPARLLRYAKIQKVVRLAAVRGSLRKVASEVPTLLRSYLRGSQQMALVEFGRFIATIGPEAAKHRVRNGGDCGQPKKPERIEIAADTVPAPDCVNPAGCLFCVHYRGIESFDYLHSILSYKEFLRLRSGMSTFEVGMWVLVIKPTMERIDDHVALIADRNDAMRLAAADARKRVSQGNHHPRWRGWIELLIEPENA